ncbi:uncharacterized protein [Triticum aestivum]|uniref:uncharacterized protein n=1 Tax=Triticum aestivum TaxID=4565 RepID=UPI001D00599D|nr:uncharacterized protein LOC123160068 [Triticum aestivum]
MANLDCVLLVVLAGKELVQKIRLPLLLLLRGSVRAGRLRIAGIEPIFNLRSPPFDASIRASPIVPGLVEPSTSFSMVDPWSQMPPPMDTATWRPPKTRSS